MMQLDRWKQKPKSSQPKSLEVGLLSSLLLLQSGEHTGSLAPTFMPRTSVKWAELAEYVMSILTPPARIASLAVRTAILISLGCQATPLKLDTILQSTSSLSTFLILLIRSWKGRKQRGQSSWRSKLGLFSSLFLNPSLFVNLLSLSIHVMRTSQKATLHPSGCRLAEHYLIVCYLQLLFLSCQPTLCCTYKTTDSFTRLNKICKIFLVFYLSSCSLALDKQQRLHVCKFVTKPIHVLQFCSVPLHLHHALSKLPPYCCGTITAWAGSMGGGKGGRER
mmetsp:Transcript_45318/g.117269  ORF Transcript_45318/g.117269 Transcript_45318/m.117269 type:complete len:278 (-) Transcript_45318:2168-3001(-)